MQGETELQTVQRHIRQGENTIASQKALILTLETHGLDTGAAEDLLLTFREDLRGYYDHLARLEG